MRSSNSGRDLRAAIGVAFIPLTKNYISGVSCLDGRVLYLCWLIAHIPNQTLLLSVLRVGLLVSQHSVAVRVAAKLYMATQGFKWED